jgi:hypothetical protein
MEFFVQQHTGEHSCNFGQGVISAEYGDISEAVNNNCGYYCRREKFAQVQYDW